MIHNQSNISYQECDSYSSYQVDGQVIYPNDSDLYLLVQKTTGMKNSEEKKVNQEAASHSVKTGLMKSLLIGGAVLTSIGALATCGYYYLAGRQSSGLSENSLLSRLSVPVMANIIPWKTDNGSSTIPDEILMAITDSPLISETPSSPYSYYEGIYGGRSRSTVLLNNHPPSLPVTMTEKPITTTKMPVTMTEKPVTTTKMPVTMTEKPVTTTEMPVTTAERPATTTEKPITTTEKPRMTATDNSISAYMAAKPTTVTTRPDEAETAVTEYKHESGRSIYYQSVKSKHNYPLGTKFFNELLAFCLAETKYDIEQAYRGTPELRCKLLDDINNKIEALKDYEALVRRINSEKEMLSIKEHGEEVMLRRKLATLYLAAESIINKKDFDVFLREVNRDYKRHSTKELEQREEKIMNYFPEEC